MNLKYSHSGDPRPNLNHHVFDPNSLLLHEIGGGDEPLNHVVSREYHYMMDFEPQLPILDIYHDELFQQQLRDGDVKNKVQVESE